MTLSHTSPVAAAGVADTGAARKARGAFFTPSALATYVTDWAVRSPDDHVLEPSCGEAVFLLAAGIRLTALGAETPVLHGVELHEASAASARQVLAEAGYVADVQAGDFFTRPPAPVYDAVIGNPPYIRFQDFAGTSRIRSREAALRAGVPLSGLASSWAAFTVHACLFLRRGGRVGLVLPAELLSVNYAAEVRGFLMRRFRTVRLVMFTERVFPEVQEEVVLLLADGFDEGPTDHFEVHQALSAADLVASGGVASSWTPAKTEGKWTPSLVGADALLPYAAALASEHFGDLQLWGDTTLGMVTGNNRYFALSPDRVAHLGLPGSDTISLSPPGSKHLRALTFTSSAQAEMGALGAATRLFRPSGEPSPAGWAYIRSGEDTQVHEAYKCQVRTPWWRVPLVKPADLLLTYMNSDTPRLCANPARAHHVNSVHGVYLNDGLKVLGRELLPLLSLNSVTLLGAETVGRAYGGGMLKLEPKEADLLPVPSPIAALRAREALLLVKPQLAKALRGGKLLDAVKLVDEALLVRQLGIPRADVKRMAAAYATLADRRKQRGRVGSG